MPNERQQRKIDEALAILTALDMPRAQRNERSAICLLALSGLKPDGRWAEATAPLIGIRAMLDVARQQYDRNYAENTRETFRRQTMHQFVDAQIASYNSDNPARPVNSPGAVYNLTPEMLAIVRAFGVDNWPQMVATFLASHPPLTVRFGQEREMAKVPVAISTGEELRLSPGVHSEVIKAVVEEFAPRYAPGAVLVYAGDTGEKWGYFDKKILDRLGVAVDNHGKMPDVVLFLEDKNWLLLVEAVTSHGPVDGKRHGELRALFKSSSAGLVFVTAFPDRATMRQYVVEIAWETEVWCADAPTHLIHFDGERFLGPYE